MVVHSHREFRAILRELPWMEITAHKNPEHVGELRKVTFVKYYAFYSAIDGKPGHPVSKQNFGKGEETPLYDDKNVVFDGDVCSVYKYKAEHTDNPLLMAFRLLSGEEAAAYKRSRREVVAVSV